MILIAQTTQKTTLDLLAALGVLVTAVGGFLALVGVVKYVIEPHWLSQLAKKKYATALWIACCELEEHLRGIQSSLKSTEKQQAADRLAKVPDWEFDGQVAWFTKDGYHTAVTAYKISLLSAWLRIYQRAMLFSTYRAMKGTISDLYKATQEVKIAFSTDTCFWYEYFDAVGDKLIVGEGESSRPIEFAMFCEKCADDSAFRLFYEQLHMYIWLVAKYPPHDSDNANSVPGPYFFSLAKTLEALPLLRKSFHERHKLSDGLTIQRPAIPSEKLVQQSQSLKRDNH